MNDRFLLINAAAHIQVQHHIEQEQYKASYTAETTVRRIESQLNRYLAKADILKNMIESGAEFNEDQFIQLAQYMMDDNGVIQAIEVAKDGVISMVYPLDGNEAAVGLDLFQDSERKTSANLAKTSGKYSIGGPYDLVQGGTGALLMDPVYVNNTENHELWGGDASGYRLGKVHRGTESGSAGGCILPLSDLENRSGYRRRSGFGAK